MKERRDVVAREKGTPGAFRRFCMDHFTAVAAAAFLIVLAALAVGSPSIDQLSHAGMEGYEPVAEAIPRALICSAVVACALWALPFGRIAAERREQGNPRNKRTRIVELKPAAAFVAVACLAVSAAAYLAVKVFGSAASPVPFLAEAFGAASSSDDALLGSISSIPSSAVLRFALFLIVCAATAFFEEGLFRVVLQKSAEKALADRGCAPASIQLKAALSISAVFGILHVASVPVDGADPLQVGIQTALKLVQGMMFGLILTGLLKRTGSFSFIVALHACYDLILFFPPALVFGVMPTTYLTGAPLDSLALAAAACALAPAAIGAVRVLRAGGACGGAVHGDA